MNLHVLVVDPDPFFCAALSAALTEHGCQVVGWTRDEDEAVRLAKAGTPDLVVTEVEPEGGVGLSIARRVGAIVPVVVLTRGDEGTLLLAAAAAGAAGCLTHRDDVATTVRRRLIAAQGVFAVDAARLGPALRTAANTSAAIEPTKRGLASLTRREREVLRLVSSGHTNEEISVSLHVSPHTIRTHIGRILKKTGSHSRADVARLELAGTRSGRSVRIEGPDISTRQ